MLMKGLCNYFSLKAIPATQLILIVVENTKIRKEKSPCPESRPILFIVGDRPNFYYNPHGHRLFLSMVKSNLFFPYISICS